MRYIDQMITEQVQTWAQREAESNVTGEVPGAWPVITISREFGARGAALAAVLGAQIGFKVWDKDLLHAIAEESGGDERLLASLDEHRRKAIDDAMRGALTGSRHTNTQYFRTLMRVVHTLSAHGKCIIVGRGAHYISKARGTFRVRVVAPLEVRVRGYAQREGLTEKKARKKIIARDTDRADFIKHHFKRDGSNPSDYDLVINAGVYTLEQMAGIVLAAYEAKIGKKLPLAG